MLPLNQAIEAKTSVLEYLETTFALKDPKARVAFKSFIEDGEKGLFKGPYISIKTPFIGAENNEDIDLDIKPSFPPYAHQLKSFARLTTGSSTNPHKPLPTILTTGTGSGKTECFLYPILDYCYKCNKTPTLKEKNKGVKVIIIYPMNALATDQAKRLAAEINKNELLNGVVTAGLFIGLGRNTKDVTFQKIMTQTNIIEDRETIIKTVPDIILTNFKMLDYSLMSHSYKDLWKGNLEGGHQLKYIVLDELHTYDGAQGTDVANLLRRLRLKLNLNEGDLCPIGTSATIGKGENNKERLCVYASAIFGENITEDAIIGEERIAVSDLMAKKHDMIWPSAEKIIDCYFDKNGDYQSYIQNVCSTWLPQLPTFKDIKDLDTDRLGELLCKNKLAFDVIDCCEKNTVISISDLTKKLFEINPSFAECVHEISLIRINTLGDNSVDFPKYVNEDEINLESAQKVLTAIFALISLATIKIRNNAGFIIKSRFVYLQVQLWQRDLTGILGLVQQEPKFVWKNEYIQEKHGVAALPMFYCYNCGTCGFVTEELRDGGGFSKDINSINKNFFSISENIRLLQIGSSSKSSEINQQKIRSNNLMFENNDNDNDKHNVITVNVTQPYPSKQGNGEGLYVCRCPECNNKKSLRLISSHIATLSSVTFGQILASDMNEENINNRKMLVFTNGVQDASFLSLLYEKKNFTFLFRQSIQQFLKYNKENLSLAQLQENFKKYWKDILHKSHVGNGDPDAEYCYRFLPADKSDIDLSIHYRNDGKIKDSFKKELDLRIDWEIASEFGLNSLLGRTLEKTKSSATYFRKQDIKDLYDDLLLDNDLDIEVKNKLIAVGENVVLGLINNILHRFRLKGAIDHEYLTLYKTDKTINNLNWSYNDKHFLNKIFSLRSTLPNLITIKDCTTNSDNDFTDCINKSEKNWYYSYFEKTFYSLSDKDILKMKDSVGLIYRFYELLLKLLTQHEFLIKTTESSNNKYKESYKESFNYVLNPQKLYISANRVKVFECCKCHDKLYIAEEDELSEHTNCMQQKCFDGYYELIDKDANTDEEQNYYQKIFDRRESPRIYSHEHTGILNRSTREKIENDFKSVNEKRRFNAINLLTATSTLEMGIDIGDLNIVSNINVPPKPSNFLQRVGRAGRKSGSSLILNYCQNKNFHEMHYFTNPIAMMDGDVVPPGCFLEAKDILKRHFLAYCIDKWELTNNTKGIFGTIRDNQKYIINNSQNSKEFCINQIIDYINKNKKSCIRS